MGHSPPALTGCSEHPQDRVTRQDARGVPSLPLCGDTAACHPRSGFVSLDPLQTPVGNREPIFEPCKVFFC